MSARQHPKVAIEVMESGLPVWTEKPPAASALEAGAMLKSSRRTEQACMTGFMT